MCQDTTIHESNVHRCFIKSCFPWHGLPTCSRLQRASTKSSRKPKRGRRMLYRQCIGTRSNASLYRPRWPRANVSARCCPTCARLALSGRAREINEQRIGHAVFGRQPDYDSSIDGIVRTQASRLRHKLERYYQTEGAAETVRVRNPNVDRIFRSSPSRRCGLKPLSEPSRADAAIRELPAAAPQRW